MGGGLQIDGVGAAGEDDADGIHGLQLRQGCGVGLDLAVHAALTDAAGDELVVLAAKVQDNDSLVRQEDSSFGKMMIDAPAGG